MGQQVTKLDIGHNVRVMQTDEIQALEARFGHPLANLIGYVGLLPNDKEAYVVLQYGTVLLPQSSLMVVVLKTEWIDAP